MNYFINYSKCEECLQSSGCRDSTFALCVKAFKEAVSNLGLTKLYPEQVNALFHFLSRENVFVNLPTSYGNLWFSRLHHLLQVNSPNHVHNLKHTVSLLLFLPWLLSWMTKWDVEILFCVESHVFAKAAKSLKASEGKLSWIAADTLQQFLELCSIIKFDVLSRILLFCCIYFIESLIDSERKHTILTLEP